MLTIKGYEKWMGFSFIVKGRAYHCVECGEEVDYYSYRYESASGWNYPMFEITIDRRPDSIEPKIWKMCSQLLLGPASYGGNSTILLAKGDIMSWSRMEWKLLDGMVRSCG